MRCVVCKLADTKPGTATVVLERGPLTVMFKCVPAQVCPNCGEEYVDAAVARQLEEQAEATARNGTRLEVRDYVTA
jgi:YgiT-type zinc finger domain-containing protein